MKIQHLHFGWEQLAMHGRLQGFAHFWAPAALQWQAKMGGAGRSAQYHSLVANLALERIELEEQSAERVLQKSRPRLDAPYGEVLGCGWMRAADLLRTATYKENKPLGLRQVQDTHAALLQFDPQAQF
jgi:hypothetical protein